MTDDFELADRPESWPVLATRAIHQGYMADVRNDRLTMPDGTGDPFDRDVIEHIGAVLVLALDEADRVLLVQQYRHPVQQAMVELPGGLRDAAGEDPVLTARRELREEGFAESDRWSPLIDVFPSPGLSDERIVVYLAEGAREVGPDPDFVIAHEEARMARSWVGFDDVLAAALDGRIHHAITCLAITTLAARRARG